MATSYLEHTLTTADTNGNKKATFSAWLKRTNQGSEHVFYTVRQDSSNFFRFRFDSDKINVTSNTSGIDGRRYGSFCQHASNKDCNNLIVFCLG